MTVNWLSRTKMAATMMPSSARLVKMLLKMAEALTFWLLAGTSTRSRVSLKQTI